MCNFISALVLRNGDVLTHPMLDSHSDLVTYFKLPDVTAEARFVHHFAKVELTPQDWMNPATWTFTLDENTEPVWFADVRDAAEANLRARAARMIVRDGEHRLIADGCWIVGGTAVVHDVRAGRIVCVKDSAQIHGVCGSAQIHDVGDSAQIHGVWGSAQLDDSARAHVVTP